MSRDPEITKFLEGVVGVVEATNCEKHMLWAENRRHEKPRKWIENLSGYGATVGSLADMPVCISLLTAEVDGQKLLFTHPTSMVVDHRLIDQWLKDELPETAMRPDGYVNSTDATNFHVMFSRFPADGGA